MPELAYLNFDLEIEKADGGYRAHVLSSPAGEARTPLGPVDNLPGDAAPQVLGGALFDAVFRDDVLAACAAASTAHSARTAACASACGSRRRPELAGLPWELLYDRQRATFLALSRETPLVRYLDLPEPAEPGTPEIRLRVLAVIASPSDYPPLDADQEWTNLKQGMADLEGRGVVTVDRLDPPTVDNLQRQLAQAGVPHPALPRPRGLLRGRSGQRAAADRGRRQGRRGQRRDVHHLAARSAVAAPRSLSACRGAVSGVQDPYSGVAQRLVRGGVPAVIAMRSAISAAAAEALARSFYTALAAGAAVDEAMAEARKTLYSGGFPERVGHGGAVHAGGRRPPVAARPGDPAEADPARAGGGRRGRRACAARGPCLVVRRPHADGQGSSDEHCSPGPRRTAAGRQHRASSGRRHDTQVVGGGAGSRTLHPARRRSRSVCGTMTCRKRRNAGRCPSSRRFRGRRASPRPISKPRRLARTWLYRAPSAGPPTNARAYPGVLRRRAAPQPGSHQHHRAVHPGRADPAPEQQ